MHGTAISCFHAVLIGLGLGVQQPAGRPDSASRSPAVAAPAVILGTDTVLRVHARIGSFTPAERAAAIETRLRRLSRDPLTDPEEVRVVDVPGSGSDIVVGDALLLTVTDADAAAAGVSRRELALQQATDVRAALRRSSDANRLRTIASGAVFTLLTALATVLLFRLIQRIFTRAIAAAELGRQNWQRAIRFQRLELIRPQQLAEATLWLLRVLRLAMLAVLLYIAVPLILSFFPWTRTYARRLFGYILTPFAGLWAAALAFVPDLFTIGAIIIVTWYILKLVRLVFVGIARGNLRFTGFYPEWGIPTYKLVRTLFVVFAFAMIWPYLPGSDSLAFQGIGVMLGLLVSFGSASAVSNVVGGIVLIYMRPFRIGDRVRIADTEGDVTSRDLLVTRVRTPKNVEITIPNAMVLGSHIVNYSGNASGLALHTQVTIGYDAPWRKVHGLLLAAARRTDGVLAEPSPFVLQISLQDFYVTYELNVFTNRPRDMAAIYSQLHENIQDEFGTAGVEILSPHYRAVRDGPAAVTQPG